MSDNLADHLEREIRFWGNRNHTIRICVYMISTNGHARIYFPGTELPEIIESLRDMEAQGYRQCSWLRWIWKKRMMAFKCWWNHGKS